jgi:hypothetical protein
MRVKLPLDVEISVSCEDGHFILWFGHCHRATHIESTGSVKDFPEMKMELIVGKNKGTISNFPRDDEHINREVDGPIVCKAAPDGVVHLEPSVDGKTCDVIPIAPGTALYTTNADADLTAGVSEIAGNVITIVVTAAPLPLATHIESEEGPVVDQ